MSHWRRLIALAARTEVALEAAHRDAGAPVTAALVRITRADVASLLTIGHRLARSPRCHTFERRPCPLCGVSHAWTRRGPSRPWKHRCAQRLFEMAPKRPQYDPELTPIPLCPRCRAPQPCGCGYVTEATT